MPIDPFAVAEIERAIQRDPARRGLVGYDGEAPCPQHLAAAADHLARYGTSVWILTGFFIPRASPPAAETDGPPGAAQLAATLLECGIEVRILTDSHCASAVRTAVKLHGIDENQVLVCPDICHPILQAPLASKPLDNDARHTMEAWAAELWKSIGPISHVIAIERVGASHTPATWSDPRLSDLFRATVPEEHWNRCHNMRGEVIDAVTPPLHNVVEWISSHHPAVKTIGIGDGGNEIGMGALPYRELKQRLLEPQASRIPCRIATDWTVVAGVSNWGALALAALVGWERQQLVSLRENDRETQAHRLRRLVDEGPAVDGVTRLQQPTVDGLPFLTYVQPWEAIRRILSLD